MNLTAGQRARLVVALGLLNVILVGGVLAITGGLEPRPLTPDEIARSSVSPIPTAPWSPALPSAVAFATPFPSTGAPTPPVTSETPGTGTPVPTSTGVPAATSIAQAPLSPAPPTAAATLARPPSPTTKPPKPTQAPTAAATARITPAPPKATARPATPKPPVQPAKTPKPKPGHVQGPNVPCPGDGPPGQQHGAPEPRPCGKGSGKSGGTSGFVILVPLLGAGGVLLTRVRRLRPTAPRVGESSADRA